MNRKRASLNEIVPHQLYQRGQIYTWNRAAKERCFADYGITAVVNFWPKIDPDFAEMGLDWSWQISNPRSEGMLDQHVQYAALSVSRYLRLPNKSVLVLCEAGKTRSVFFCILVLKRLNGMTYQEARAAVAEAVPGISLKGFMEDWLEARGG